MAVVIEVIVIKKFHVHEYNKYSAKYIKTLAYLAWPSIGKQPANRAKYRL